MGILIEPSRLLIRVSRNLTRSLYGLEAATRRLHLAYVYCDGVREITVISLVDCPRRG